MVGKPIQKVFLLIALHLAMLSAACVPNASQIQPTPTPEGAVAVHPNFLEFYNRLGGAKT